MACLFPSPSVMEEGSVGLQIDTVKLYISGHYTETRPFPTSAPSQCKLRAAWWSPFVAIEEMESVLGQLLPTSPKELQISPLHRRVWEGFLWLVHCLEVTVSSKGFWHAKPVWKNIVHLFLRGAVFMGGSLCFMFEDFNRSRGLRELRRGSFSGHFHKCKGAMSILILFCNLLVLLSDGLTT